MMNSSTLFLLVLTVTALLTITSAEPYDPWEKKAKASYGAAEVKEALRKERVLEDARNLVAALENLFGVETEEHKK